jgi:hypothetical protein
LEDELAEDLSDGGQHKEERRLLQERLKQAQQELENFRQEQGEEARPTAESEFLSRCLSRC